MSTPAIVILTIISTIVGLFLFNYMKRKFSNKPKPTTSESNSNALALFLLIALALIFGSIGSKKK